MSFLLDTNVLSELRKGDRADARLRQWYWDVRTEDLYSSVVVLAELRRGVEVARRRDVAKANALEGWLRRVLVEYHDRVLPVSAEIAGTWGRLMVPDPLPILDGFIAATAFVHGLTVVTRNVVDFERVGVPVLNPFGG